MIRALNITRTLGGIDLMLNKLITDLIITWTLGGIDLMLNKLIRALKITWTLGGIDLMLNRLITNSFEYYHRNSRRNWFDVKQIDKSFNNYLNSRRNWFDDDWKLLVVTGNVDYHSLVFCHLNQKKFSSIKYKKVFLNNFVQKMAIASNWFS
jgi:hypothetical protein